jgi:exodeoxyribonuclease VII small subunit
MNEEKKEIEFESALKKLETIVENLENGDLSLEAALKQYEEGVRMADICSKRLNDAQKKVEVLMKTSGGKLKAAPFSPPAGGGSLPDRQAGASGGKMDPPPAGEVEHGKKKKK